MPDQEKRYQYFDIPKQERDSAIGFLLNSLLKSRAACRLVSNKSEFDEDVNIYLAHLLFAASLPDYQDAIQRYLGTNVSEMAELMEKNDDRIIRYFIYKVNADHLLVHLGIFKDLENEHHAFGKSESQFSSMAQNYYKQAASYNRRIYRRQTAIGSVLEKLGRSFDRYKTILRFARKEFFHFASQFHDESFQKFCEDMSRYENEERRHRLMDQFLDAYAEWVGTRNQSVRLKLEEYAKTLRVLDPGFSFDLEGRKP
ncbi:MAG: hypothetical protein HY585_02040 [Candidatus Omnitrophica bacterium]|nr:hypothetical protein [Candidatus Omnitrophota bacterium]